MSANPLASFWHPTQRGLDGVRIIRRTGTGSYRRRQIEPNDLPALARRAEQQMRRYIARAEERRAAFICERSRHVRCNFSGCHSSCHAGGLCSGHYSQKLRGIELRPKLPWRAGRQRRYFACAFPGCDRPHRRVGYCDGHSAQLKRGESLRALRPRARNGFPVWQSKNYYALKRASLEGTPDPEKGRP